MKVSLPDKRTASGKGDKRLGWGRGGGGLWANLTGPSLLSLDQ